MKGDVTLAGKIAAISNSQRASHWSRIIIFVVTLCGAAFFLFWNLGSYSLWEDETHTALAAKGIVRTGVPYAFIGDGNLAGYANGRHLKNLQEHVTGPIPSYLTALSFLCFGESVWSARFPHALMGLVFVALLLYWVSKSGNTNLLIMGVLLLGGVSCFLYFRQSRYYGCNLLFTLCTAYFYWNWKGNLRYTLLLTLSLLGLLLSNTIAYAAVGAAVIFDYLIWKRKSVTLV